MGTVVRVPDIGDANDVEVIELCCAVGDTVEVGDPLIVLESDKASMEVPSEVAGTIMSFSVAVGDTVDEGQDIAEIDAGEAGGDGDSDGGDAEKVEADADADSDANADEAESEAADEPEETAEDEAEADAETEDEAEAEDDEADDGEAAAGSGQRIEVHVPDVGDASDVTVVEICVAVGAEVAADDALVVLESDKASMEIGAPQAGTVVEIAVADGDGVAEGALVAVIETAGSGKAAKAPAKSKSKADAPKGKPKEKASSGDGDKQPAKKAPAKEATAKEAPAEKAPAKQAAAKAETPAAESAPVYAGPAVRRMARELGVDLTRVKGTGGRGRIVKDDVQNWVKEQLKQPAAAAGSGGAGIPPVPVPDFTKFGETETVPLTRVMRVGGANLHRAWLNLPHVTHNDEADVTDLEEFRAALKEEAKARDARLTPLAFMVKACVYALKEYPRFNASLDAAGENFILKKYYNIGMAVDTPDGLMVPVIRGADTKSIWEIAADIIDLSTRARDKKLRPADMSGGTFSISSLGPLGGTSFTPIINAPEVAILGVAKTAIKPVWNGSEFLPRQMLPLSLSYDHRAINGADAARFTTTLVTVLSDIRRLALM